MIDPRLGWFAIGATCSAVLFGWPWHPRFSRYSQRMGPPRGNYGLTTPKPRIIPRGTRPISYLDPEPNRQPANPFTGKPVKPQLSSPQIISGDTHD